MYFWYFWRKKFLKLSWVLIFTGSQIFSSAKYHEIEKLARMRLLVNKCKNTGTKINISRAYFFSENIGTFWWMEIRWVPWDCLLKSSSRICKLTNWLGCQIISDTLFRWDETRKFGVIVRIDLFKDIKMRQST